MGLLDHGQVPQPRHPGAFAAAPQPQMLDQPDEHRAHQERLVVVVAGVLDLQRHVGIQQIRRRAHQAGDLRRGIGRVAPGQQPDVPQPCRRGPPQLGVPACRPPGREPGPRAVVPLRAELRQRDLTDQVPKLTVADGLGDHHPSERTRPAPEQRLLQGGRQHVGGAARALLPRQDRRAGHQR